MRLIPQVFSMLFFVIIGLFLIGLGLAGDFSAIQKTEIFVLAGALFLLAILVVLSEIARNVQLVYKYLRWRDDQGRRTKE